MSEAKDNANTLVPPPIALFLAILAGLALDWVRPLPFLPRDSADVWAGIAVFVVGLALVIWSAATFRAAGTRIETHKPTSAIVDRGPYRFTRNPIYVGMFLGVIGLALAFNTLWLFVALVVFFLVIRFGVVAREEVYLERKFGGAYLSYKSRVRRWL